MTLLRVIVDNLPPLTVAAVLDILLLTVLIYQALLIVKGTRAAQILAGVVLLWLVYYGAVYARLQTIQWLLDNIFPYLVFALIIVFQNEIRRALAKIGRNPFNSRLGSLDVRQASEDIVLASSLFSSQRTGALIVVERDTGLRTFTESGIQLNAHISYDLLVAIFQRSSPLHDGAVIVRKDKIVAASCFLPLTLSVNPIWGTQLGTRHRAAIGVTEETDAVAVVVSEETGSISLAIAGSLEPDLTQEQLAERLAAIFRHPVVPAAPPSGSRSALEQSSRSHRMTTGPRL
jgi:diadenylate cyclase